MRNKLLKYEPKIRIAIMCGLAFFLLGCVWLVLFFSPTYIARLSILPQVSNASMISSSFLGQELAGLIPGGNELSKTNIFLSILRSSKLRSIVLKRDTEIREQLANRLKNPALRDPESASYAEVEGAAVKALGSLVAISKTPLGLVEISSISNDYKFSSSLVRAYAENLRFYIDENAIGEAKRKRIFIERTLQEKELESDLIRKKILAFRNNGREVLIRPSTASTLEKLSSLVEAEGIDALYSSILGNSEAPQSLAKNSQNPMSVSRSSDDFRFEVRPTSKLAIFEIEFQKLQGQAEALSTILVNLRREYELAKIDESKESFDFNILDTPFEGPDRASPSKAKWFVLLLILSASFGGGVWIVLTKLRFKRA